MTEHVVLKVVVRILTPFILLYGFYIQFHGEYSPGGGFQAGVIWAAAVIVYSLINGLNEMIKVLPLSLVRTLASLGVLIYGTVGIASMLLGGNFLDYSALSKNPQTGQQIGIMVIELGVGITVFSVMVLIFYSFAMRSK